MISFVPGLQSVTSCTIASDCLEIKPGGDLRRGEGGNGDG